jgi:4-hydroxy-tetrahydrodipicolinate reductase
MRIGIIGYGKMGKEVMRQAESEGIGVTAVIDPGEPGATAKAATPEALSGVDIAIDFSNKDAVIGNIRAAASAGKNIVVGTSGWSERLPEAEAIVREAGTGLVYSTNFSVGMSVFLRITDSASKMISRLAQYDIYVSESHHNQKTDAPGGTAKALAGIIIKNVPRKTKLASDRIDGRQIDPAELHVVSMRSGWNPGRHIVGFDSPSDNMELIHATRSRADFAFGAIFAAKWVSGKKGIYSMDQMMDSILG